MFLFLLNYRALGVRIMQLCELFKSVLEALYHIILLRDNRHLNDPNLFTSFLARGLNHPLKVKKLISKPLHLLDCDGSLLLKMHLF